MCRSVANWNCLDGVTWLGMVLERHGTIGGIMGGIERFSRAGVQVLGRRSVSKEVS